MIASLMMYARPEVQHATVRYWAAIREALAARGIDSPEVLAQQADPFSVWQAPDLVLSQTCGLPFRTRLHRTVQLVGTPDFDLPGCDPGYYNSAIVVRADDPREALNDFAGARLAYNMTDSQSGFAALYTHLEPYGFWFKDKIRSGGHVRSAQMVADGLADIAAIDAQTWRLIERYEPWVAELRVLERTGPTPALPYITGLSNDPDAVFDAVTEAIAGLSVTDAEALGLRGMIRFAPADYLAVPTPPATASD